MEMSSGITFCKDLTEVVEKLADNIEKLTKGASNFNVGISGGSLINVLSRLADYKNLDFNKWSIFFVDERKVPLDDPESNYGLAKKNFLDKVPIPSERVFSINPNLSIEACAKDYAEKLKNINTCNGYPSFDLLILGIGPDGHICSLFPNHPLLKSTKVVDYISNSPKPPPERITFTLFTVNNAKNVIFVCTGAQKADALKAIIDNKDQNIPAAKVSPLESIVWILDESGKKLSSYPFNQ